MINKTWLTIPHLYIDAYSTMVLNYIKSKIKFYASVLDFMGFKTHFTSVCVLETYFIC